MSIQNEINRIEQAKSDIKSAIMDKGVEVPESVKIDGYPELVRQIGKNYKYRFGVISDIHIGKYDGENDFIRAIRFFESQEVDFVVITGDLTNNGTEEEIIEYKRIKDELNVTFPIYACRGNHDCTIGWEAWEANVGNHPYYTFEKAGDTFILLSIEDCDQYSMATTYLHGSVRVSEFDPINKRVFLFMHYPIFGHAGLKGNEEYGFDSTTQFQYDIYNRFNCYYMLFSGHTHYDFDIDDDTTYRSVNIRTDGMRTTVHVPSCAYTRYPDHTSIPDNSQGYVVDVYETGVNLQGVDFKTGSFLSGYNYFIRNDISNDIIRYYEDLQWAQGSINSSTGEEKESSISVRTQLITLSANKTYYLDMRNSSSTKVYFYDSGGNHIDASEYIECGEKKGKTERFVFKTDDSKCAIRIKTRFDDFDNRNISLYRVTSGSPIREITLDKTRATLAVGDTVTLTATVKTYGDDRTANWSSSDGSVATVSDGVVTAVGEGIAIIYANVSWLDYVYETKCILIVEGTTVVNGLANAVDSNGNPYNGGIGYKAGVRIKSSGLEAECSISYTTGFIPYSCGQKIVIQDFKCPYDSYYNRSYYNVAVYNSNKELIALDSSAEFRLYSENDVHYTNDDFKGGYIDSIILSKFSVGTIPTDAAYVRISAIGIGENPAIYIV